MYKAEGAVERRKPRVLAISYLFPNPVLPNHGIFVFNRLNALSKYADITVINPLPWSPVHRFIGSYKGYDTIPQEVRYDNFTVYHPRFLSIPKVLKGLEIVTYRRAVESVIRKQFDSFAFDVIDLHWTFPDLPAGDYLAKRFQRPFLVTLRGLEALHRQDGDIREKTVTQLLPEAKHVIALSEELKSASLACGALPENNSVVRNGVNTQRFIYMEQAEARKSLKLPSDELTIVMVGSLIKRKGIDLVIRALPALLPKLPNVRLRVLGSEGHEGQFQQTLMELIQTLGLEGHVVFEGAVPNERLVTWYNAASVFCLASRGEGSPNVLTEALACGCPAVASEVGAVKDIVESEAGCGRTFENENVTQLEECLRWALTTQFDRAQLATNFSKYDWDWCARKVSELYSRVCNASERELST